MINTHGFKVELLGEDVTRINEYIDAWNSEFGDELEHAASVLYVYLDFYDLYLADCTFVSGRQAQLSIAWDNDSSNLGIADVSSSSLELVA